MGVGGGAALLAAMWIAWDLLPYVTWGGGDLAWFALGLVGLGTVALSGPACLVWRRRRTGRGLVPALGFALAATLLAALPVAVAPGAIAEALAPTTPRRLPWEHGPAPAMVAGLLVCGLAALGAVSIGLLLALGARRFRHLPPGDVHPDGRASPWSMLAIGALFLIGALALAAPDMLVGSPGFDVGIASVEGRTARDWLGDLTCADRRPAALDSLVDAGPAAAPVLIALGRCGARPGDPRRARALHAFDALRHAVGRLEWGGLPFDSTSHRALDGPVQWRAAAIQGLARLVAAEPAAWPVLVQALDLKGAEASPFIREGFVRTGAVALPALAERLRGPQAYRVAATLRGIAERRPELSAAVVSHLRAAARDSTCELPLAPVEALAALDPDAGDLLMGLLARVPSDDRGGLDAEPILRALLAVPQLPFGQAAALSRWAEGRGVQHLLAHCVLARHQFAEPASREWLLAQIVSRDYRVREFAGRALRAIGPAARPHVPAIVAALRAAPRLAHESAEVLCAIGGDAAVAACVADARGASSVRLLPALFGLRAVDADGADRLLVALLASPNDGAADDACRLAIATGSAEAATREVVERWVTGTHRGRVGAGLRHLRYLGADNGPVLERVRALAADPEPAIRLGARLVLARMGEDGAAALAEWRAALADARDPLEAACIVARIDGLGATAAPFLPDARRALARGCSESISVESVLRAEGCPGAPSAILVLVGP